MGTAHLLLGLLVVQDGVAARVLAHLDVTVEDANRGILTEDPDVSAWECAPMRSGRAVKTAVPALCALAAALATGGDGASAQADADRNLALAGKVWALPPPRGGNPSALTDGRTIEPADRMGWHGDLAAAWQAPGAVNVVVDLGGVEPISEVSIRFLGGTPWDLTAGICIPGRVQLFVAGQRRGPYHQIAEYSKFREGDKDRFAIPREEGKPLVHRLRFADLRTAGRFVGLQFYGGSYVGCDELYVLRGDHDPRTSIPPPSEAISDFTITDAQLYFHKPAVHVTRNIVTPVPVGCLGIRSDQEKTLTIELRVPKGVRILGGGPYAHALDAATVTADRDKTVTYTWRFDTRLKLPRKGSHPPGADKQFAMLYATGAPVPGAPGALGHRLTWGDYTSCWVRTPLAVRELPPQPTPPKRLITTLGWWRFQDTPGWPHWEKAFRHIGLNTLSGFPKEYLIRDPATLKHIVDFNAAARAGGFRIQMVDNPLHRLWHQGVRHARDHNPQHKEILCQFGDGRVGNRLCPSYRGLFYQEELSRFARAIALFGPGVVTLDIELWSDGCVDPPKCERCRADKDHRGVDDWEQWKRQQGVALWDDLRAAAARGARMAAIAMPQLGVFNWYADEVYHTVWPFNDLYPDKLQTSQPRFYAPFEPHHLNVIGEVLRRDRLKLGGNHNMPWLGNGDFGTFSGDMFCHALLECFCNGSVGVNLYSNRVLDADLLAGFARAIRAVAPVEDILVDGIPFDAEVIGPGRVSGMRLGEEIVLLVADYYGDGDGSVTVKLPLASRMRVFDLDRARALGPAGPGEVVSLRVELDDQRARILHLQP